MYNKDIVSNIERHTTKLYDKYQTPELVYHNLAHTKRVVKRAVEIAANYPLNNVESFILMAAAWFHDCGHLFGPAADHEKRSVLVMREFFVNEVIDEDIIESIEQCILSTEMPNAPKSLLEEILCDADSYHLATDEFLQINKMVKGECELRNKLSPLNWNEDTLDLLEQQVYFTTYCRELLEDGKRKSIALMRKFINDNSIKK